MASNGRLPETEKVARQFNEIMMASRGEVKAVVTSAEVSFYVQNRCWQMTVALDTRTIPSAILDSHRLRGARFLRKYTTRAKLVLYPLFVVYACAAPDR